jgi:SAM-dependent methyltransferase
MDETELQQMKDRLRTTWTVGDYGVVGRSLAPEAEIFMGRLGIKPGDTVLDVACGTGNMAFPAVKAGAVVTGVDIAANLLEQATARAAEMGLKATFELGDAEELAFADASFDWVVSMVGVMFALRPERVAAELLRVCRPCGTIALGSWTLEGFIGRMFRIGAGFLLPPAGVASPILWGNEAVVRERLGAGCRSLTLTRREAVLVFPMPPAEVVELFLEYYGPTHLLYGRLEGEPKAAYKAALVQHWTDANEDKGGGTVVRAEYLEAVGVRG